MKMMACCCNSGSGGACIDRNSNSNNILTYTPNLLHAHYFASSLGTTLTF